VVLLSLGLATWALVNRSAAVREREIAVANAQRARQQEAGALTELAGSYVRRGEASEGLRTSLRAASIPDLSVAARADIERSLYDAIGSLREHRRAKLAVKALGAWFSGDQVVVLTKDRLVYLDSTLKSVRDEPASSRETKWGSPDMVDREPPRTAPPALPVLQREGTLVTIGPVPRRAADPPSWTVDIGPMLRRAAWKYDEQMANVSVGVHRGKDSRIVLQTPALDPDNLAVFDPATAAKTAPSIDSPS
jgi:hypothetical protein